MGTDTKRFYFWVSIMLSAPLYIGLSYFTHRSNFALLIGQFFLLFGLYSILMWIQGVFGGGRKNSPLALNPPFLISPSLLIICAIGLRLILLFSLPNLSDDYFRFVWDGRLLTQGISPFLQTPEALMQNQEQAANWGLTNELFQGLNSPKYFTIYPPVNQWIFGLGANIFPTSIGGSVLIMKLCLLLAEVGSLFLLVDLLKHFKLPLNYFSLYAFNPLVIIELSANLHFEALLIFFLLVTLWSLVKYPYWIASIPFALAISSKLLPLMFFPLFIRRLGWVKTLFFSLLSFLWVGLLFVTVLDLDTLRHMGESVGLYFRSFEFNASVYYLVRWWGFQEYGYNIIQSSGKNLAIAVFLLIWLYVIIERKPKLSNFPQAMMWVMFFYFTGATIVHPWYICTLVALCSLTTYRFPIIWTLLLPLTYFTYRTDAYTENLWLVGLEYVLLWGYLVFELRKTRSIIAQS